MYDPQPSYRGSATPEEPGDSVGVERGADWLLSQTDDGHRSSALDDYRRRQFLSGVTTVAAVGLAGCTEAGNLLVDFAYLDLNVLNDSDEVVVFSLEVLTEGDILLQETVELNPGGTQQYDDLWDEGGVYTVSTGLQQGIQASETIETTHADDSVVVTYGGTLEIEHRPRSD